jgi:hypothetical protein
MYDRATWKRCRQLSSSQLLDIGEGKVFDQAVVVWAGRHAPKRHVDKALRLAVIGLIITMLDLLVNTGSWLHPFPPNNSGSVSLGNPHGSTEGSSNAAYSALGICIRNAEEGGSYAWGPGNGGGAYQFVLGTWEKYGGAASQFGVAGPAYQDQIFNNAIAADGASNWTAYDGC